MPKSKDKSEHKQNVASAELKNSTCSEVHPKYTHGNVECIRIDPYNALYFCPESRAKSISKRVLCYYRLIKKLHHQM